MQTAPVQQFHVGGEVYEGANPQYAQMFGEDGVAHWMKVAKGVPWRKVSKPMSRAEKRMNRRPKHGNGDSL